MNEKERVIVQRFLDEHGRVTVMPQKRDKRRMVLEYLSEFFQCGRDYTEKQVNALLEQHHTFGDFFLVRRELCDSGFLQRERDGSRYWRPVREEMSMEYRKLCTKDLERALFGAFERRQQVTRCWRKAEDRWVIRDIAFVDQWSEEDYAFLVQCLRNTVQTGGVVFGAFDEGRLKGFVSVEPGLLGSRGQYLDLSSLHVSAELRGHGVGKRLLALAAEWAREKGAEKLYISAHSAVETQAFYRAVGCVESLEYSAEHVEKEPCDCQLEYQLK